MQISTLKSNRAKDKEIEVTSIEGMMLDETCIELYSLALESGE